MVANRIENQSGGEAEKGEAPKPAAREGAGAGGAASSGGGIQAWLPMIVALVAMPLLAYATTTFFILPKLLKAIPATEESAAEAPAKGGHAAEPASAGKSAAPAGGAHGKPASGKEGAAKGGKNTASFSKVLVNVAGTMGARYIQTSFTMVASSDQARTRIEENRDLLLDLSSTVLGSKTLGDLEKPGWRNLLRSELVSVFNDALGKGTIQEIYLTEFAIQ
jgi:flagellar protein FliL